MPDLSPAAGSVAEYLNTQIDAIMAGDGGLRHGDDPIHDTRVAIRRLRSTMRVFRPQFNPIAARRLDEDLRWFSGLLGEVRDAQVQQQRLLAALDELPAELVLGPVRARIDAELKTVELPARRHIDDAMQTPRYHDLLTTLRVWRARPAIACDITEKQLRRRARKAAAKADDRLDNALAQSDDTAVHRARKAAKRARYAAELLRDTAPSAKRHAKHYQKIQSTLGDYQDTVVARVLLRRLATSAGTTVGENGFTFGLLYAREQRIARRSRTNAGVLAA